MIGVLMRIVLDLLITFGNKVIFFLTVLILPSNKQGSLCHPLVSSLVSFFATLTIPLEKISTSFIRFISGIKTPKIYTEPQQTPSGQRNLQQKAMLEAPPHLTPNRVASHRNKTSMVLVQAGKWGNGK